MALQLLCCLPSDPNAAGVSLAVVTYLCSQTKLEDVLEDAGTVLELSFILRGQL